MVKIRRLCDNKAGYVIQADSGTLLVAWEDEESISILDEYEVMAHEDDAALQIMCDMMCGNLDVDV